jgi:C4-dicarboxylate-specific signal transduction histidine kinase
MILRYKLIVIFLVIALLPLLILSAVSYRTITDQLTTKSLNQLSAIATQQEQKLQSIIERNREKIILITNRVQLKLALEQYSKTKNQANLESINTILKDIKRENREFETVSILNAEGVVVTSTETSLIGKNYSQTSGFIKGSKDYDVVTYFLDKNQQLKVYFSGPLILQDKLIGVILIESSVDNFLALTNDYTSLGDTGETYIAQPDKNGDFLVINPLRFDNKPLTTVINQHKARDPIYYAISRNEGVFTSTTDYRNKEVFSATRYLDGVNLGLVVKIDKDEALEPVSTLRKIIIFVTLISSIIVIMVGITSAQVITDPIAHLTEGAKQISAGNLLQKIDITSRDEIGLLAQTFNEMAIKLHESYTSLEKNVQERTEELENIKHNLEDIVKQRTSELEKSKLELEDKVKERTTELEEKLQELERMNKVMIGRELKMVDLKNQNELLAQKLSELTHTN